MKQKEAVMIAKREIRNYSGSVKVWAGKYRNSNNLLHWHSECELICVEQGGIDVFCEKRKYTLSCGEALLVESEQMHHMHAHTPDTILIVIFYDDGIVRPYLGEAQLACPRLSGKYPVADCYGRIHTALTEKRLFFGGEAASEILRLTLEIYRNEPLVSRSDLQTDRSFRRFLEELDARFDTYTFDDAVDFMKMSPAYFSRFFHETTGSTFSHYLNCLRTENAVELLLKGEKSVTDIAAECGFGTIRTFNRVFKELTGYSPTRLPRDFTFESTVSHTSSETFDPTSEECKLIESNG